MSSNSNEFKLTSEQFEIYMWLKSQRLNTDDDTLNYWSRKYPAKRIIDVVKFANRRRNSGQSIRNIGGWVHKLLITGIAVANEESEDNSEYAKKFTEMNKWIDLKIYEKYVKDEVTSDDLPLTMPKEIFRKALESLYQKSILYKDC